MPKVDALTTGLESNMIKLQGNNGLSYYKTLTGKIVVFRPFGRYAQFSSLDLALEILFRQFTGGFAKINIDNLEDTDILEIEGLI